jgi:hypothetical protein
MGYRPRRASIRPGQVDRRHRLKYAEMVFPDGTVNQENLPSARATVGGDGRGGPLVAWRPWRILPEWLHTE